MRFPFLVALFMLVLQHTSLAVAEEGSGPPAGSTKVTGNPALPAATDAPGTDSDPQKPSQQNGGEKTATTDFSAIRDKSLRQSAAYLQIDLDQLYRDRVGEEVASGPVNLDQTQSSTVDSQRRERMKTVLRRVLSSSNGKDLVTLISKGSPRADLVVSALRILQKVSAAESATVTEKSSAIDDFKFVEDEKNHQAFHEVLVQEHARMMANEDLQKLETRQRIEMELAKARHLEKLQTLERERLERELGRAQ